MVRGTLKAAKNDLLRKKRLVLPHRFFMVCNVVCQIQRIKLPVPMFIQGSSSILLPIQLAPLLGKRSQGGGAQQKSI
jgi:hypothetical protein